MRKVDILAPTEAFACLRTAARQAGRLSLVTPTWRPDASDAYATLRAKLMMPLALSDDGSIDASAWIQLRNAADDVLALVTPISGPLADMWAYVAAIVVHVASHELSLREEDEDVMNVRL